MAIYIFNISSFLKCFLTNSVFSYFLGYKGNLAERKLALIFSIVLTIPVLLLTLFLMLWQTYV